MINIQKTIPFIFFLITTAIYSQVGINTTDPDDGSILDVKSNDKGILIPRVNIEDISTIAPITNSSTESLLVYNTNTVTGKGFYYWNGTDKWIAIGSENIYTSNGTLNSNREIDQANQHLRLTGTAGRDAFIIKRSTDTQETGMSFQNSSNSFEASIYLGSGLNAPLYISSQGNNTNANNLSANASFNNNGSNSFQRSTFYNTGGINTPENVLGSFSASNGGGMVRISDNTGATNHFLTGANSSIFNFRNLDYDLWFNTENANHTLYLNAGTDNVGIGTSNPREKLHISGANSQVRIDALNQANNTNNIGPRTAPVHADINGNLIVPPSPASSEIVLNEINSMPDSGPGILSITTEPTGDIKTQLLITTETFTLTQRAIIMVNYIVSVGFTNAANNGPVDDGKPKIVHNFINIRNTNTNALVTGFVEGISGQSYTNSNTSGYISIGFVYNAGNYTGILDPGTYEVNVHGSVLSGRNAEGSTTEDAFTARFGQARSDNVKVIALY